MKIKIPPSLFIVAVKATKIVSVLKVLKLTKVLVTATSLLVSLLAYNLIMDPWSSLALVGMLFVHEMGHVLMMRNKGMGTPAPVFIPFLGAAIFAKNVGDRDTEAAIGIGGPLVGTLATIFCIVLWWFTGSTRLLTAAFFGAWLNLFNLIPIKPLDGGRIIQVMGDQFKYAGLFVLVALTLWLGQPSLILIWILVLMDIRTFPRWWQTNLAISLTLGMGVMFILGYSEQPILIDILDMIAAGFFCFLFYRHDQYRDDILPPTDPRPCPSINIRIGWMVTYLGLVASLWYMLDYVVAYMPVQS